MKRPLSELLADCENVLSFNHWDAGNLGLGGIYIGLRLRDLTAAIPLLHELHDREDDLVAYLREHKPPPKELT